VCKFIAGEENLEEDIRALGVEVSYVGKMDIQVDQGRIYTPDLVSCLNSTCCQNSSTCITRKMRNR